MKRPVKGIPPLVCAAGVSALLLGFVFVYGCGSSGDELVGTGRVVEGDQCFLSTMTLQAADAGTRRDVPTCDPEDLDPWECADNPDPNIFGLDDLMTETAGDVEFCANAAVFGEVLFVDNDPDSEHVQLAFLAFDDTGMRVIISVNDIDLTQIGENPDGILDTPLVYDGCNFTAGVNLNADCDVYECTWAELSTNPCGGIVSTSATDVPITCYEDDQPDSCDPAALTFGAADQITIKEITVVTFENNLAVLEETVVSGTYDVTVRAQYDDGTHAEIQLTGEFRTRVSSRSFSTVTDLVCTSCTS